MAHAETIRGEEMSVIAVLMSYFFLFNLSFARAATVIAVLILPLVTLIRPALAIFFGITMGGQCFVCGNIGMRMCTTANERGIACVIAAALAFYTPGWDLLAGIIVWAVVEGSELFCAGKATE